MNLQEYINNPEIITKLPTRYPLKYVHDFVPNTSEDLFVCWMDEDYADNLDEYLTKVLNEEVLFWDKDFYEVNAHFEHKPDTNQILLKLSLFDYEPEWPAFNMEKFLTSLNKINEKNDSTTIAK